MTKPIKRKKSLDTISLYEKWCKKHKMDAWPITFCSNDTWAGHVVKDFADFIIKEMSKK